MYNKIFTKILDSSIWLEPDGTRLVWLTLIAAMDEDGFVQFASVANLAHRARVTLEAAQTAVLSLEGPDENSSDPENEGRRIERVPGGWMILNAPKYRDLVKRVVAREQTRKRVAKHRGMKRKETPCNGDVTHGNDAVTPSESNTESDCEIARKTPSLEEVIAFGAQIGAKRETCESFFHGNESRPIAPNGNWTFKDGSEIHRWKSALAKFNVTWKGNDAERSARKGEKPKEDHLASRHASL